ncbi:MAG: transposase [Eubacterium sp.]|nr:transposase [Eubacterium sp.]
MKNSVLDRLKSYFDEYFSDATKPTARNLFLIIVSILALDIFRSVRFAHRHVLAKLSDTSLNAYYYALKTDRLDHESWRNVTLSKALKAVPVHLAAQPLFLSIDDTMVEKEGDKFDLRSRLFDHAAHNGSNYPDGHCMVSILLSFPVLADGSIRCLSVPLGYQLWDKKQTKLEIAAEMVRHAVDAIGPDRQVFLLCDSWYPKGCVAGLVDEYNNLDIICNARIDTVMYGFPPGRTGKRGRPRKYGERLSPEDFELESPKTGDWKVGVRPVLTRLWGERVVYAIVTLPKSGNGSRRLFFSTKDPESIILDYSKCEDDTIRGYGEDNKKFLPPACYSPRWNIEVSYYESKTFWSLEEYRVRSREGIERLVNPECIAYSAMTLLPYSDGSFSCYQSASAQETRFGIGQEIQASIIFSSFAESLETVKKAQSFIKIIEGYVLSGFKKIKKL